MNEKEKSNKKENHKSLWKKFNEKWLWVNIISYIVGTTLIWWLFSTGIINLITAIFLTIINFLIIPLMYYFFNYFRKSKYQKLITKIILVGCGTFGLGGIIWIFFAYILIASPWAPLRDLPALLKGRIHLLILISSWGIGAIITYIIGKKREWRPPSHLIN